MRGGRGTSFDFLLLKALIYELVFYFEYTFFIFSFFKGDVVKFATL